MKVFVEKFKIIVQKIKHFILKAEAEISVRFVTAFICMLLAAVAVFQILNATVLPKSDENRIYGSITDIKNEQFQSVASEIAEFPENQGMISLSCSNLGGGGVYVYINNTMKANITSSELKNIKVKIGDVVIIKGHGLTGDATVRIHAVVGNIDASVVDTKKSVGNLGKLLIKIK